MWNYNWFQVNRGVKEGRKGEIYWNGIDGSRSRINGCLSNNEANGSNNKEENKPIKKSRSHQKNPS